jgi:hypothetical protein
MEKFITAPASGREVETLTTDIEFFGPPGKYFELRVRGVVDDDNSTVEDALNDSSLREYKVSAMLGKSHTFHDSSFPHISKENGDSFLLGAPDTEGITVEISGRRYVFYENSAGEYSYIELSCTATNFKAAQAIFFDGITPYLDVLSYSGNCSLFLKETRIEDVKHRLMVFPNVAPYRKQLVSLGDFVIYPELREILSMYREAKNASSNLYKFLCFYKILEGLYGNIRPNIFKRAKAIKLKVDHAGKRIPDDPHLIPDHRKYVGRTIRNFFESVLTPEFRHGAAHFVLRDGTAVNLSSLAYVENYTHILYITEICIRMSIDDTINIIGQLEKAEKERQ